MFKKILVANRGEIAVRIIRAARELGVKTVAVYSEADKESLHVKLADEAICIGPASSSESYLKIPNIISAALVTGAEGIHPGYGFLAENSGFAKICAENNIIFIRPNPDVINLMRDKATATATAIANAVPITKGSDGIIKNIEEAKVLAEKEITYPVIVKAMRVFKNKSAFPQKPVKKVLKGKKIAMLGKHLDNVGLRKKLIANA